MTKIRLTFVCLLVFRFNWYSTDFANDKTFVCLLVLCRLSCCSGDFANELFPVNNLFIYFVSSPNLYFCQKKNKYRACLHFKSPFYLKFGFMLVVNLPTPISLYQFFPVSLFVRPDRFRRNLGVISSKCFDGDFFEFLSFFENIFFRLHVYAQKLSAFLPLRRFCPSCYGRMFVQDKFKTKS